MHGSAEAAPQKPLYYKTQSFTRKDFKNMHKDCAKVGVCVRLVIVGIIQGLGKLFWKWFRCSGNV